MLADLYHLGLTMRFPRALQIRDDLEISDCMTASGTYSYSLVCTVKLSASQRSCRAHALDVSAT